MRHMILFKPTTCFPPVASADRIAPAIPQLGREVLGAEALFRERKTEMVYILQ